MKLLLIAVVFLTAGCAMTAHEESYDLNLSSCLEMREDPSHRFWKNAVAVQGCDMLIMDHEMEGLSP